jgi:hypothetical protein
VKILLSSVGTRGDVQLMVALALQWFSSILKNNKGEFYE